MPPLWKDACKKWVIRVFIEKIWAPVTALVLVTGLGHWLTLEDNRIPERAYLRPYATQPSPSIEAILTKEAEEP